MKRISTICLLLVSLCYSGRGQSEAPNDNAAVAKIKSEILQKEDDQNQALLKNDADLLGSMCADELAWTNASGVLLSKAQMLADMRSGKQRNSTIIHDDVRLHVFGSTVVVTGRSTSTYTYGGKKFVGARRFTNVWIKQNNRWLLAVHHVTPAAEVQ